MDDGDQDFPGPGVQQGPEPLGNLIFPAGHHRSVDHAVAPYLFGGFRVSGGHEHLLVEGQAGIVGELLLDGNADFIPVFVDANWGVGNEGRGLASGGAGPFPDGGEGHVFEVGGGTDPAYRSVGAFTASPERAGAEGGGHYGHVQRGGNAGVGVVVFPVEVDGAGLEQGPQHLEILLQVSQGIAEGEPEHGPGGGGVAWANTQPEASRGQLGQDLDLLGHDDGMPGKGGHDGSAECHVPKPFRRRAEQG